MEGSSLAGSALSTHISGTVVHTLPTTNGTAAHTLAIAADGSLTSTSTLKLKDGCATLCARATIAGEWLFTATHAGGREAAGGEGAGKEANGKGGNGKEAKEALALGKASAAARVRAGAAEWFDLVTLNQRLDGMRLMVHARDAFGNLDESCEREVVVELNDGAALELTQPDAAVRGGSSRSPVVVKLLHGVGELTGIQAGSIEKAA